MNETIEKMTVDTGDKGCKIVEEEQMRQMEHFERWEENTQCDALEAGLVPQVWIQLKINT